MLAAIPKNCARRHGKDRASCEADLDPIWEPGDEDALPTCLWDEYNLPEYRKPIHELEDRIKALEGKPDAASKRRLTSAKQKLTKAQEKLDWALAHPDEAGSCIANYQKEGHDYDQLEGAPHYVDGGFLANVLSHYGEYKDIDELQEIWNNNTDNLRTKTEQDYGITSMYRK